MSHDTEKQQPPIVPNALVPGQLSDVPDAIRKAVREEFDEVLPHVVTALKANDAVKALSERLHAAERRLAERESRPLVAGIRKVLRTARRLDYDPEVKDVLVGELEQLLV